MTDASAADDLAYVRRLMESGAHAPLLGGRFMAWWGLLLSAAYFAHHLALNGAMGDQQTVYGWIWLPFVPVGLAGQWLLSRTMPAKAGAGSAGNLASRAVWAAAGLATGSMAIGSALAARNGAGPATFDWIAPVGFAVYACALIVTGALARNRVVVAAGAGAVVMVGLFTAAIRHPDRYLIAAIGIALVVLLPGLILLRAEPRSRV